MAATGCPAAPRNYAIWSRDRQCEGGHVSHAVRTTCDIYARFFASEIPTLRIGDEKIAKCLHAGHGLELFGIDEIGIERDGVGLAEQLDQPAVLLDQIIRQHGDAESALAGPQDAENIIDDEVRHARTLAVARDFDQPARALQV